MRHLPSTNKERGMYVCNCNGITEQEVIAAIEAGAEDVHKHCGTEVCCGRCVPEIEKRREEIVVGS
jgi:bacterioferritin-associated ferredoxin